MNNADFWASVHTIIAEGFTSEGLLRYQTTHVLPMHQTA